MANRYYTDADVRGQLNARLESMKQSEISRESGTNKQNLSLMVNGAPIRGKLLAWLGFQQTTGLYEKRKP